MAIRIYSTPSFHILLLLFSPSWSLGLHLLSDLTTPCVVLDVSALQRHYHMESNEIPALLLPTCEQTKDNLRKSLLHPHSMSCQDVEERIVESSFSLDLSDFDSTSIWWYWHCSVTKSRQNELNPTWEERDTTFLVELDIPLLLESETTTPPATLVLGLQFHHVGSYYWARAAGRGRTRDVPGIELKKNVLQWASPNGPTDCNTNDGKISEWVAFLRRGDTVQLRPHQLPPPTTILGSNVPVYGISWHNRPLGSEPQVVNQWK
jgi:hypothetical protein